MEKIRNKKKIDDFELEPVPFNAKRSWYVISLIWLAIGIDVSGLFLGSLLSQGLSVTNALLATFIGSSILAVLAMLCANIGFQSSVSTSLMSSTVFGRYGGKALGAINGISLIGWFAFQTDFFAHILVASLSKYDIVISNLSALIFGALLMMVTAIYGVRALGKLSAYSVPLMVTLITIGLYMAAGHTQTEQEEISAPLSMGQAISYVMSIWILAAVAAPDISRYAKTRKDAILGAGFGFLFGNSATLVVAILLLRMTGTSSLVDVFFGLGLGVAAIFIIVFAQWTTNSSNLVSGSLGLSVVFPKVPRPILVTLMTLIGLVIAQLGMIDFFTTFLTLLGVVIAPSAGVYLAQYYFLDRRVMSFEGTQTAPKWLAKGLVSWAFGCLISACTASELLGLFSFTSISAVDGILASFAAYIVLIKLSEANTVAELRKEKRP
ncbi:cytosine permease [Marinomonas pollencensis]|uniref:Cytosine permease n=1 Tax=Marinomonas pollencensis TaxID=491954 RepID=A0A3E0DN20_9GAMM|nr:cytosine permease [Marinomonas pollencensis]REG83201.1 cytosine permease [Marinomonas pollencensis]